MDSAGASQDVSRVLTECTGVNVASGWRAPRVGKLDIPPDLFDFETVTWVGVCDFRGILEATVGDIVVLRGGDIVL